MKHKTCPFCGGEPETSVSAKVHFSVACSDCHVMGAYRLDQDAAWEAWDKRQEGEYERGYDDGSSDALGNHERPK